MRGDFPLADGFVLSCPVSGAGVSPVREIRKRGNIPLVLQDEMVVELKRSDMLESWRSTCALGRKRTHALMAQAAGRISSALEDDETAEIGALASDVAAFFLLALHDKGLDVAQASRFCQLAWSAGRDEPLSVAQF
ncbi:MAG: hypothetical protein KGO53_05095 [Alphaproteobacteria bacterium]|nr:hypothetical protein [Alphaproteobacteria bacterium]